MKVPLWMVCGLFVSILLMDMTTVWVLRSKIGASLEAALDAAMVGGLREYDARGGRIVIDESGGQALAAAYLKENLNLNDRLENSLMTKTRLEVTIVQDGDKPRGRAFFRAVVTVMVPKLFGLEGIPVVVSKTQYHLSSYK